MATIAPERVSETMSDIKVIDVDTHLSEPEDLWTKRAPAKFKDRVPQVGTVNGQVSWVIDGHAIGLGASASSIFHKDGRKSDGLEFTTWRNSEVLPASYDAKERVKLMDEAHIWAQVVFPCSQCHVAARGAVAMRRTRSAPIRHRPSSGDREPRPAPGPAQVRVG